MPHHALSPAEAERLEMLIEECAEVIKACTKTLRHGYGSYNPTLPVERQSTNKDDLVHEMVDVQALIWVMEQRGDVELPIAHKRLQERWEQKLRYTHHQEGGPT